MAFYDTKFGSAVHVANQQFLAEMDLAAQFYKKGAKDQAACLVLGVPLKYVSDVLGLSKNRWFKKFFCYENAPDE